LHIVFYARIGEEQQAFDIADVINTLCDKLISRHPHIYGDVSVKDDEEVKKNWEMLKLKEGKRTVLGGVPSSLPALIKSYRIQDKAAQVKFEWENIEDVWRKVEEEQEELKEAVASGSHQKIEEEFGDLLFALVNYSRFLKVDAEAALERTNIKFMRRFNYIEERVSSEGKSLSNMSLDEMDALWNEAKRIGL
jgi:MazG family protein